MDIDDIYIYCTTLHVLDIPKLVADFKVNYTARERHHIIRTFMNHAFSFSHSFQKNLDSWTIPTSLLWCLFLWHDKTIWYVSAFSQKMNVSNINLRGFFNCFILFGHVPSYSYLINTPLLPTSKLEGHAARMRRALKTLRCLEAKKEPLTSIYSKRNDVLELYLDVYVDDVLKSDIFLVMWYGASFSHIVWPFFLALEMTCLLYGWKGTLKHMSLAQQLPRRMGFRGWGFSFNWQG